MTEFRFVANAVRRVLEHFAASRRSEPAPAMDGDFAVEVDLPSAPCPWCHRHYTAAGWGEHYNQWHESHGHPFVPFEVIETWYSSTDAEQMARTLPDVVSLYITGTEPAAPASVTTDARECGALETPVGLSYECCEPAGHAGDHIARGMDERELRRWPNAGTETAGLSSKDQTEK